MNSHIGSFTSKKLVFFIDIFFITLSISADLICLLWVNPGKSPYNCL